ncbi:hypothetical protein FRC04_011833 [Tulasnella sp. 424]|nr:hypothetical protein FRC04_011833 [Tulasnella sp. 424]
MAYPRLPYRVCLGEYKNRHSLFAHSAKGIEWENVHPGLENVLKRIHTRDILDLALGCEGQYFLKYREGSAVRQAVTPEVLSSIYGEVLAPSKQILKIAFGNPGELWAIFKENGSATQILQVRSRVSEALDLQKRERTTVKDIAFVELGRSQDNYAIKIMGELSLGGNIKVFGNHKYRRKYDRMIAVTLSPLDDSIFLVTFDDGSSRSNLPNTLEEIVQPHLDPEMSLLLPERGGIPSALFRISKMIGFRVSRGNDTTELELLNPSETDYRRRKRFQKMFRNGWKHPQKSKPDLRYIYALKLPGQLITSYLTYRLNIQQTTALSEGFEHELFHGTPRRCLLGNEPELTKPCDNDSCRLCRIIKTSFTVKKAGTAEGRTFLRFGRGIYTSSVSSKADDYTVTPRQSGYRALLVAQVILGKPYPLKVTTSNLIGPPKGYNSVIGEVGSHLNYDEQVVYKDEAALPVYLVVYKP